MAFLFNWLISIALILLASMLKTTLVSTLYSLVGCIPGLAITIRRLHDIGKSGFMTLIVFIPIVGIIWLLVLLCKTSKKEIA